MLQSEPISASEILVAAADFLEQNPDRWTKCSFFRKYKDKVCMCSHGAIAYFGNPEIKKCADLGYTERAQLRLFQQYVNRSQQALAHQKARQVGLVYTFNDDHRTTIDQVVAKLRKAALQ